MHKSLLACGILAALAASYSYAGSGSGGAPTAPAYVWLMPDGRQIPMTGPAWAGAYGAWRAMPEAAPAAQSGAAPAIVSDTTVAGEIERLRAQVDRLEAESGVVREDLTQAQKRIAELEKALGAERGKAREDVQRLRAELESANAALLQGAERLAVVTRQSEDLAGERDQARDKITRMEATVEQLRAANGELQAKMQRQEEALGALRADLDAGRAETAEMQRVAAELEQAREARAAAVSRTRRGCVPNWNPPTPRWPSSSCR